MGVLFLFYLDLNCQAKDYSTINRRVNSLKLQIQDTLLEHAGEEVGTGFNSYCICLSCLHQFEADLRDEKVNKWHCWYGYPSFKEVKDLKDKANQAIEKLRKVMKMDDITKITAEIEATIKVLSGGIPTLKDERKCPKCGSEDVKTVLEMIGKECPKCREGTIVEVERV